MTTPLTAAQRQMVADNLGLTGWAVNRWARHLPTENGAGYTQEDARQDAVFGLAQAAQDYDPALGYSFSTYAGAKLRQAIQRGIGNYHGINYRRDAAHKGMAPVRSLQSLDAPVIDGDADTFTEKIPEDHDTAGDMDVAATVAIIENHRHHLCADAIDHDLLDAMIDPEVDWLTASDVIAKVYDTWGISEPAARHRIVSLRGRIATLLGAEPPTSLTGRRRGQVDSDVADRLAAHLQANPVITATRGDALVASIAQVIGTNRDQASRILLAMDRDGLIERQIKGRVTERITWLGKAAA